MHSEASAIGKVIAISVANNEEVEEAGLTGKHYKVAPEYALNLGYVTEEGRQEVIERVPLLPKKWVVELQ